MLERALLAAALIALFALTVAGVRLALRRRDRSLIARLNEQHRSREAAGAPRLVYFTTSTCVVCRVQQEPAIEALSARLPDLRLERYDAVEERELASRYGVLSVPTTAVYARDGSLVTINRGFAPAAVLLSQLEGTELQLDGGLALEGEPLAER